MNLQSIFPVILSVGVTVFTTPLLSAQERVGDNPVEIGQVDWSHDLDAALEESKKDGKPVLVLFQEVPGCAGCQKFGREVLSQPLIVEAIEDEFIPVVVYNNRSSGQDKVLLDRFGERPWNYQVLRFLDQNGKDIIERKEGISSIDGVASRMISALKKHKRPVPKYLSTLVAVNDQSTHATAAFAMYCFWTGEYRLGGIDGVIATEAGWLDGREVTLVKYNKEQLGIDSLAQQAARVKCADKVYTQAGNSLAGLRGGKLDKSYRPASTSDQKKQISRWQGLHELSLIHI